jgi:CBS domain-containing protein
MTKVSDILERKGNSVVTIRPDETVLDAARRMNEERIGAVVVSGDGRSVDGIFTERDVMRRVVAAGRPPESTLVADVMSSPVTCCKPGTTLNECQSVMTTKRLRHIPVVEDGELIGMISSGDILAQEVEVQQTTIEYLHGYLHGRV